MIENLSKNFTDFANAVADEVNNNPVTNSDVYVEVEFYKSYNVLVITSSVRGLIDKNFCVGEDMQSIRTAVDIIHQNPLQYSYSWAQNKNKSPRYCYKIIKNELGLQ